MRRANDQVIQRLKAPRRRRLQRTLVTIVKDDRLMLIIG